MNQDISVEEVELKTAEDDVSFLEQLIEDLRGKVLQPLLDVVDIHSDLQAFVYVGDDNNQIQTKQDSNFVCEGIVLVGDDTSISPLVSTQPHSVGVEITPMDGTVLTEGQTVVTTNDVPTAYTQAQTISQQESPFPSATIPIDMFVPTFRKGDTNLGWSRNVDYWHVLASEWFIEKGRTVNFYYRSDVPTGGAYTGTVNPPNPALVGFKVYG